MAKQINEAAEFIKFFKTFYTNSLALSFDSNFSISHTNNMFYLSFPKQKYTYITGTINITNETFISWVGDDDCTVTFDSDGLDLARKSKIADFVRIDKNDSKLSVIYLQDSTECAFEITKEPLNYKVVSEYFPYSVELPVEVFDNSVLNVYFENDALTLTGGPDNLAFDSPVKNFQGILKKNASYTLSMGATDDIGYRTFMLESRNDQCIIQQYFKVLSFT